MEAMTERWTDGHIDDLSAKIDRVDSDVRALRVEMKTEFTAVRGEMREGFEKVDQRFEKIDARFEKIDARFERLDERLHDFYGVLIRACIFAVGLLGVLVTVIGIQA